MGTTFWESIAKRGSPNLHHSPTEDGVNERRGASWSEYKSITVRTSLAPGQPRSFEVLTMVKTHITRPKRKHWSTISDLQSS